MINYRNAFKLALLIAVVVTSYLVFSKPNYSQSFQHMDKVGHLGSFFGLAFLAHYAFKPKWYYLFGILASYAVLIELVQSRLPYRSASIGDVIADFVGIALFYLFHFSFLQYKKLKDKGAKP
ncbi:VanZ family protein [Shewanella sp. OMA3-2]|uniref:VanZ family protein n=1 Tax=Shewanella sp. OMA3-2 TaxID=2908650 RepID=UPI001F20A079|nr:VanZ family protein [Shewanella sp. OMA3-2]UJF22965.1 VanZ family protein [Shewanella sp. OMA3-2]